MDLEQYRLAQKRARATEEEASICQKEEKDVLDKIMDQFKGFLDDYPSNENVECLNELIQYGADNGYELTFEKTEETVRQEIEDEYETKDLNGALITAGRSVVVHNTASNKCVCVGEFRRLTSNDKSDVYVVDDGREQRFSANKFYIKDNHK